MPLALSNLLLRSPGRSTVRRLERRIVAWLREWAGTGGSWDVSLIETRRFASGRLRRVFRARHDPSGRTVAVKTNSSARANRAEYMALETLHRSAAGTVLPLALSPGGEFFAIGWIDAPLLKHRMEAGDRHGALLLAGSWLAEVQRHTAGMVPTGRLVTGLRLPLWARPGSARYAIRCLRARSRRLARQAGRTVMLHGDFQPGNIFDFGNRIVVFDRIADIWGSPHLDVAKFLVYVAAQRARALESGRPWDGDNEGDRRSFFAGYGPVPQDELPQFDLAEDIMLYRKWQQYRRTGQGRLAQEMRLRGLVAGAVPDRRPGRLVDAGDGRPYWADR